MTPESTAGCRGASFSMGTMWRVRLRRIVCCLANASSPISGVVFATVEIDGDPIHVSEYIADQAQYRRFLSIPGYAAWEGNEEAHGATIDDALKRSKATHGDASASATAGGVASNTSSSEESSRPEFTLTIAQLRRAQASVPAAGELTRDQLNEALSDVKNRAERMLIERELDPLDALAGCVDDVVDAKARAQYRSRLGEIEAELEEARAYNDPGRIARLEADRASLMSELKSTYGLHGRPRRMSDDLEKARKRVREVIVRAFGKMDKELPALAQYLRATIHLGATPVYRPVAPINWDL